MISEIKEVDSAEEKAQENLQTPINLIKFNEASKLVQRQW